MTVASPNPALNRTTRRGHSVDRRDSPPGYPRFGVDDLREQFTHGHVEEADRYMTVLDDFLCRYDLG